MMGQATGQQQQQEEARVAAYTSSLQCSSPPHIPHSKRIICPDHSMYVLACSVLQSHGAQLPSHFPPASCVLIDQPTATDVFPRAAVAVIGDICSGATVAASGVAAAEQVPLISPAASSPQLSGLPFFFRTVPSDRWVVGVFVYTDRQAGPSLHTHTHASMCLPRAI